jgi:hypothetical protein
MAQNISFFPLLPDRKIDRALLVDCALCDVMSDRG